MKRCPDIDRLVDLEVPGTSDPRTRAHLLVCSDCRHALGIIGEMRTAYRPQMYVPRVAVEKLVDLVLEHVPRLTSTCSWKCVTTVGDERQPLPEIAPVPVAPLTEHS